MEEHWIYENNFVQDTNLEFYNNFYKELLPLVSSYETMYYGSLYESKRLSCVFVNDTKLPSNWSYNKLKTYKFEDLETVNQLKLKIENLKNSNN